MNSNEVRQVAASSPHARWVSDLLLQRAAGGQRMFNSVRFAGSHGNRLKVDFVLAFAVMSFVKNSVARAIFDKMNLRQRQGRQAFEKK